MTNLESVRKEVIKAVPEIVELEFGCRIKRPYEMYHTGIIIGQDNGSYYVLYDPISNIISTEHDIQPNEILGRPIRLADVLATIGESDWYVNTWTGRFFKWSRAMGEMVGQPFYWTLREDDLSKQSPDIINFLNEILKRSQDIS